MEAFAQSRKLTAVLDSGFLEERIYPEYFDNRLYMVEQYLDFVQRVLEDSRPFDLKEYVKHTLSSLEAIMELESEYYMR